MSNDYKLEEPVNIEEKYLYGINVRLNVIIDMLSNLINVIAHQNGIATENVIIEEEIKPKRGKKVVKG